MAKIKKRDKCTNIPVNKEDCKCASTSCSRHGFCCACIEYHRENGGLPGCLR